MVSMTYKLKVINGVRAIFVFSTIGMSFLLPLFWSEHFNNPIISTLLFICLLGILIYLGYRLCLGTLAVKYKNEELDFFWWDKPLLDFRKLGKIRMKNMKKIVIDEIDNKKIIRNIYTKSTKIKINTLKPLRIFKDDSIEFIELLNTIHNIHSFRIIDSWEDVYDNGYLKIYYWGNTVLIFLLVPTIISGIIFVGFEESLIPLIFLLSFLPQFIATRMQIKAKFKEKNSDNME